ncbi:selenocysteine-specific translation elongation factor [Falsiroseomonas sp. CW058]|uniref:selenocysteine-specific translation elongation factor n=1 Tax=Falsiroseomonas sp. CW058 TaxID=3388664 RepID=UPI003D31B7BC
MRHALVGVLGHVDHGKTALVRALTGTETDRLPEERARGISIVLGFARLLAPCGAELDLVDVPGHERFVRAMVAGATAMGGALLAVDAAEGVRAQTVEHAEIAAILGIRRGVVAVTRSDRAAPESAARAAEEARALARRLGLGDWPVVVTSALTGQGLAELAGLLGGLAGPSGPASEGAWMPLDRAFSHPGAGTVVTGALRRGVLRIGEEVEILPGRRPARIRGLQIHGRAVEAAGAGRRVAVALRGTERGAVAAGDALATPGLLAAATRLDVRVALLASVPRPLQRGEALRLLLGTAEVGARLHLLDRDAVAPGETAVAQLRLDAPVATPVREPFVLRLPSPARTVGGGVVLDPDPPRRRMRDAPLLSAMAGADAPGAAALRLRDAGMVGLPAAVLARLAGSAVALEEGVRLAGGLVLHRDAAAAAEGALLEAVEAAQRSDPTGAGPDLGALRHALPPGAPLEGLAARLVAARALLLEGGRLRRRGLDAAALLSDADRAVLAEVEGAFRAGLLAPPDAEAVVGRCRRRAAALHHLLRAGVLVRAPDAVQKREVVFHRDALDLARRAIRVHFAARPDGFAAGECGRLLGISRRYAIPLLERLDAERFTRRKGDRRHLAGGTTPAQRG